VRLPRRRWGATILSGVALLTSGCAVSRHYRAAPEDVDGVAHLDEQHEWWNGHVFIWWVDEQKVRDETAWRRVDLDLDVAPGSHVVECSYSSESMHSVGHARVRFTAEAGRRYVLRARAVKNGFWQEVGKNVLGDLGPSTTWVAWIEDEQSGMVVGGIRPTHEGLFATELPAGTAVNAGLQQPKPVYLPLPR
jgi:hypothetical protein